MAMDGGWKGGASDAKGAKVVRTTGCRTEVASGNSDGTVVVLLLTHPPPVSIVTRLAGLTRFSSH